MSRDILSDVLRGVRLRGAVFFYVSGSGGWAAEAPSAKEVAPLLMRGVEHVIEYHLVAQGGCWAGIPNGPSVKLSAATSSCFRMAMHTSCPAHQGCVASTQTLDG